MQPCQSVRLRSEFDSLAGSYYFWESLLVEDAGSVKVREGIGGRRQLWCMELDLFKRCVSTTADGQALGLRHSEVEWSMRCKCKLTKEVSGDRQFTALRCSSTCHRHKRSYPNPSYSVCNPTPGYSLGSLMDFSSSTPQAGPSYIPSYPDRLTVAHRDDTGSLTSSPADPEVLRARAARRTQISKKAERWSDKMMEEIIDLSSFSKAVSPQPYS